MIFIGECDGWCTVWDLRPNESVPLRRGNKAARIGCDHTREGALVEAEYELRIKLAEVQRLLTAEREKTRTDKPPSATY